MIPRVYNQKRELYPRGSVYVGRGSPWGNPFVIGPDGSREDVCDLFESEVLPTLDLSDLIGRHLVCFCVPKRCHASALLAAARRLEIEYLLS